MKNNFNIPVNVRDFYELFGPQGIQSHMTLFAKNQFLTIVGSHLEFLRKTQNTFISERCDIERF